MDLYSNYDLIMPSNSNIIIPPNFEDRVDTLVSEAPNTSKRGNGKKDRNTKICTAQGVRDRRVRLSINIARDFFNLQDMLGFDKASKTLGWLLDKSKVAIDELTMTVDKINTPILEARQIIEEKDEDEDENQELNTKGSTKKHGKKKIYVDPSEEKAIRRINRAKARERARERTKTKKDNNYPLGYYNQSKEITSSLNYNYDDMITNDNNYPLGYYNYHNNDQLNEFEIGSFAIFE